MSFTNQIATVLDILPEIIVKTEFSAEWQVALDLKYSIFSHWFRVSQKLSSLGNSTTANVVYEFAGDNNKWLNAFGKVRE